MSYDYRWFCPDGNRDHWIREPKRLDCHDSEFETLLSSIYGCGNRVSLSAGQNVSIDELFVFRNKNDAQQFFDEGFLKFECLNMDDQGAGFDHVILILDSVEVGTKGPLPGTLRASSGEALEGVEDAAME